MQYSYIIARNTCEINKKFHHAKIRNNFSKLSSENREAKIKVIRAHHGNEFTVFPSHIKAVARCIYFYGPHKAIIVQ